MSVTFDVVSLPVSPELSRALDIAEEQADLAVSHIPMTGFELDALEAFRTQLDKDLADAMLFGLPA